MGTRPPSISSPGIETAFRQISTIVGADHLRPATAEDAVDGTLPQFVVEPGSPLEVARVLKMASEADLHVIPRGAGTKLGWGNPPRGGQLIVSTRRLDRIVEHAWGDMTATIEAGCAFSQAQKTLSEHGQRLALDPLWPERATIGGILATNDSGALRIRFGGLRDLIIGITLALPDGTLAKSGGKVVKNVAGYDLPKLATGSLGTLAIITQAIFRLYPVPREVRSVSFCSSEGRNLGKFVLAILDSTLVPTGLQIRAGNSSGFAVDLRFEGTAAGCEVQITQSLRAASGLSRVEPASDPWDVRSSLWTGTEPAAVCKASLLPANLGMLLDSLGGAASRFSLSWRLVAQAIGTGLLRLEADNTSVLVAAARKLREELESQGGSLVILGCSPEVKAQLDVWGSAGDALDLANRIKAQFDPGGILNPGRFIARI